MKSNLFRVLTVFIPLLFTACSEGRVEKVVTSSDDFKKYLELSKKPMDQGIQYKYLGKRDGFYIIDYYSYGNTGSYSRLIKEYIIPTKDLIAFENISIGSDFSSQDALEEINTIIITDSSEQNYQRKTAEITELIKSEEHANRLNADFIAGVEKFHAGSPIVFSILRNNYDKMLLQSLYSHCLLDSYKLGRVQKADISFRLSELGHDCKEKAVLSQLSAMPHSLKDLIGEIYIALSFTKTYPSETKALALAWFNFYWVSRNLSGMGDTAVVSEEIDQLLAACGSSECFADILENLKKQIGYSADKINALNLLTDGHYKPAFPEAEKLALDKDEESEVKRAALRLMRTVSDSSTEERLQMAIKSLELNSEFMKAYGDDIKAEKK